MAGLRADAAWTNGGGSAGAVGGDEWGQVMIRAINGVGVNRALVICDRCFREETVACDYGRRNSGDPGAPNIGQINKKITGNGWSVVKGALICPSCEAKRKSNHPSWLKAAKAIKSEAKAMQKVENVTDLRQPTREQSREISALLHVEYDTDAGRYRGDATDKTIAEIVGGGCMPGWVAAVRVRDFGDSGGNEAVASLSDDLAKLRAAFDAAMDVFDKAKAKAIADIDAAIAQHLETIKPIKDRMSELDAAQEKIIRAVGPKAGAR